MKNFAETVTKKLEKSEKEFYNNKNNKESKYSGGSNSTERPMIAYMRQTFRELKKELKENGAKKPNFLVSFHGYTNYSENTPKIQCEYLKNTLPHYAVLGLSAREYLTDKAHIDRAVDVYHHICRQYIRDRADGKVKKDEEYTGIITSHSSGANTISLLKRLFDQYGIATVKTDPITGRHTIEQILEPEKVHLGLCVSDPTTHIGGSVYKIPMPDKGGCKVNAAVQITSSHAPSMTRKVNLLENLDIENQHHVFTTEQHSHATFQNSQSVAHRSMQLFFDPSNDSELHVTAEQLTGNNNVSSPVAPFISPAFGGRIVEAPHIDLAAHTAANYQYQIDKSLKNETAIVTLSNLPQLPEDHPIKCRLRMGLEGVFLPGSQSYGEFHLRIRRGVNALQMCRFVLDPKEYIKENKDMIINYAKNKLQFDDESMQSITNFFTKIENNENFEMAATNLQPHHFLAFSLQDEYGWLNNDDIKNILTKNPASQSSNHLTKILSRSKEDFCKIGFNINILEKLFKETNENIEANENYENKKNLSKLFAATVKKLSDINNSVEKTVTSYFTEEVNKFFEFQKLETKNNGGIKLVRVPITKFDEIERNPPQRLLVLSQNNSYRDLTQKIEEIQHGLLGTLQMSASVSKSMSEVTGLCQTFNRTMDNFQIQKNPPAPAPAPAPAPQPQEAWYFQLFKACKACLPNQTQAQTQNPERSL